MSSKKPHATKKHVAFAEKDHAIRKKRRERILCSDAQAIVHNKGVMA
jgi:hypothetical protein